MQLASDHSLFLRVIIAMKDREAADVQRRLEEVLVRFGTITRADAPKPYWKDQQCFEFSIEFQPALPASIAFDQVLDALGSGWYAKRFTDGGNWAVWNAGPTRAFIVPEATWANLESLTAPNTDRCSRRS